jgi:SAM-dependent methyltransferase
MRLDEHRKLYELEDTYWWFVGRRAIIRSLLRRHAGKAGDGRALDIGCGTGRNLLLLEEFGQAIGADPSMGALGFCRERGAERLVGARIEELPFADGSLDLVTALDVLEHVDDDAHALREVGRVVRPGGVVMLTAPAYGMLWSDHDEALDHRRRYSARQIGRLVEDADLRIQHLGYCITCLFAPILAFRVLQRIGRLFRRRKPRERATALLQMPRLISALFVWLLRVEAALLRRVRLPFGVSVVCVARKDEE